MAWFVRVEVVRRGIQRRAHQLVRGEAEQKTRRFGDRARNLALDGEDVLQLAIVRIRPQAKAVRGIHPRARFFLAPGGATGRGAANAVDALVSVDPNASDKAASLMRRATTDCMFAPENGGSPANIWP